MEYEIVIVSPLNLTAQKCGKPHGFCTGLFLGERTSSQYINTIYRQGKRYESWRFSFEESCKAILWCKEPGVHRGCPSI
jgi:hypothetical protein